MLAQAFARHRTASAPAGDTHPPAPADLVELVTILHQYRSDMLRPPASDSRERRVAMIDAVLAKHGGA